MSESLLGLILEYFETYGYLLVFLFLLLENFIVLGLIVPGETVLLVASFLAATGRLNIFYVIATAAAAAILGNNIGYLLGREGGRRLVERFGGRLVTPERLRAAEAYFDAHGPKTVFIGRFAAGVRVFIPALAGASKMAYSKFLFYTVTSVLIWTTAAGLLGYFFGRNWQTLARLLGRLSWLVLGIILAVFVYLLIRKRRQPRKESS